MWFALVFENERSLDYQCKPIIVSTSYIMVMLNNQLDASKIYKRHLLFLRNLQIYKW